MRFFFSFFLHAYNVGRAFAVLKLKSTICQENKHKHTQSTVNGRLVVAPNWLIKYFYLDNTKKSIYLHTCTFCYFNIRKWTYYFHANQPFTVTIIKKRGDSLTRIKHLANCIISTSFCFVFNLKKKSVQKNLLLCFSCM